MRSHGEYLDLTALSAFVALADQVRAAPASGDAVAGGVLTQVARLEASLGARLFEPDARPMRLTPAGLRLHQSGLELLASEQAAIDSVRDVSRHPAELAVFAAPPTVAAALASAVAVRFQRELPAARLRFIEGMSGHIREWLATGRVDVGVLLDSYGVPGIPLWSEPLYLVADIRMLPEDTGSITFAQLATLPILLPSALHGLRYMIDRQAERSGVALDIRLEGDSLNTLMDWVIEGLGVAVLPIGAVTTHHRRSERVRLVPIVQPVLTRHLLLCTASNKHPSATVQALIRIIREEADRLKPVLPD